MLCRDAGARRCLDLVINHDEWIIRRKHRVEIIEIERYHQRISIDFRVPATGMDEDDDDDRLLPLFFLRKADGDLFNFDLRSHAGDALSLPTRRTNGEWSALVAVELAYQVLGPVHFALNEFAIENELRYIAMSGKASARGILLNYWPRTVGVGPLRCEDWRAALMRDPRFRWLVSALADSSIVAVRIPRDSPRRTIVKLSFDTQFSSLSRWQDRAKRQLRESAIALGLSSYRISVVVPWANASSFHCEFSAPPGMRIVASRLDPSLDGSRSSSSLVNSRFSPVNKHHDHVHDSHASTRRGALLDCWLRVNAGALGVPAIALALLVLGLAVGGALASDWLSRNPATDVGSILVALLGVAATLLTRPDHPVTVRLLVGARLCLTLVAVAAFAMASRLAFATNDHPASSESLCGWFSSAAVAAAIGSAGLLAIKLSSIVESSTVSRRTSVDNVAPASSTSTPLG